MGRMLTDVARSISSREYDERIITGYDVTGLENPMLSPGDWETNATQLAIDADRSRFA